MCFTFGEGWRGQLGNGAFGSHSTPYMVKFDSLDNEPSNIACGYATVAVRTVDNHEKNTGPLFVWGEFQKRYFEILFKFVINLKTNL